MFRQSFAACILLFHLLLTDAAFAQGSIDQAAKLILRARDTANSADYTQVEALANKALRLEPDNLNTQRYRSIALLGEGKFSSALALAISINKRVPDDVSIWALLSDIHFALGDYAEAQRCAQWVLDLRRNSPLGSVKAAQLREVFGDLQGASELYFEALQRTPLAESEERSWLMIQSARIQLHLNELTQAATILEEARKLAPGSVVVLTLGAELANAQKDYPKAATLLEKIYQAAPTASHLYAFAEALRRAGRNDQAQAAYQEFEANIAGAGPHAVLYYADRKKDPGKALVLASEQVALRHDVETLDAYAWALYRNGNFAEAQKQMNRLLSVGTRESGYFCHAAQIAAQMKDDEAAKSYAAKGACGTTP